MELQQSLNDTRKEAADNERTLQHWQNEHDKLKLEDIEWVIPLHIPKCFIYVLLCSDDDDDDEVQENATEEVAEPIEGDGAKSADVEVKDEAGEARPKKKAPARTLSYELHIYSAEELAGFKKREMIADAELLDGKSIHDVSAPVELTWQRTQRNSRTPNQT